MCAPANGNDQQIAVYGLKTAMPGTDLLVPQDGCVTIQGSGGCAFWTADGSHGNDSPASLIHGTLYAPAAYINLEMKKKTFQAVDRGIVARAVRIAVWPNEAYDDPVIYSPNFGTVTGADRVMLMTACENGSAASCSKPRLRAMIRIRDYTDDAVVHVGDKVVVESWTIVR
jgi:hypothetical protein